jgi:hypothetical protein
MKVGAKCLKIQDFGIKSRLEHARGRLRQIRPHSRVRKTCVRLTCHYRHDNVRWMATALLGN